jgi:hypothetical protein|tara:strand:+ start:213 stop:359 length:147 start_codon:yes stop_codon:yes gene_type:complete
MNLSIGLAISIFVLVWIWIAFEFYHAPEYDADGNLIPSKENKSKKHKK